jgi:thiosulfate/3-mercaptopyruvate sulfurtransferase
VTDLRPLQERLNALLLSAEELHAIYGGKGVTSDQPVVAYYHIGDRSAPTRVALHELLGYDDVRNHDGSWTEWGAS